MRWAASRSGTAFAALLLALALAPPVAAAAASGGPGDLTVAQKEQATGRFLQQLSDLGLWSGVVACSDAAGDEPYTGAFGTASYELGVPMSPQLRMPIASNTKLMTSVALHQLQEQGLLNVSAPAADYIDLADFGLEGSWCPRVHNAPPDSPCEQPTLHQMLTHTSGLWDSQSCMTPESVAVYQEWQRPHCLGAKLVNYSWVIAEVSGQTPAVLTLANWTLQQPLAAKPGQQYSYTNDAFWLLTYIIQKVSNQTLGEYFRTAIFEPAGLNQTFYDLSLGQGGEVHRQFVWNGGYTTPIVVSTGVDNRSLALDGPGQIKAATGFYNGFPSWDLGAGAVMSTAVDLHNWYRVLFGSPERIGLSKGALEELAAPYTHIAGPIWEGRGVGVDVNASAYYFAGGALSWFSFPSIKLRQGGGIADESPACALISNLSPDVSFAEESGAEQLLQEECAGVPLIEDIVAGLVAAEPKAVADMSAEERRAALVTHLCHMQAYSAVGMMPEAYVRDAVAAHIWDARSDDLESLGLAG